MAAFIGFYVLACVVVAALVAWAKIERRFAPLTLEAAHAAFRREFPDQSISGIWISPDGRIAIARGGDRAFVIFYLGDGLVARSLPLNRVLQCRHDGDKVSLLLDASEKWGASVEIKVSQWPPVELTS